MPKGFGGAKEIFRDLQAISSMLERLLPLEERKYEALRSIDVRELMQVQTLEEELLLEIAALEKRRQETMVRWGYSAGMTLRELSEQAMDAEHKVQFAKVAEDLRAGSKALQRWQTMNRALIESNLGLVEWTLDLMGSHQGEPTRILNQMV